MLVVTLYPLSRYRSSHNANTALVRFLGRHKPPPNGPPCNRRVSIQQRPPDDHDQKGRRDGDHPIYPNLRGGVQLVVPVGEERGAEESLSGVSATARKVAGKWRRHTEMNVAGRNVMVRSAIDFITRLSCWARRLYACSR
jgi:hypothetical protein